MAVLLGRAGAVLSHPCDPAASAGPCLLGPADVRVLAERWDVRPTKQRGQNFVIDPNTVRRIVTAAGIGPDDVVLEVGPGLGSLTLGLLASERPVVAVEIDATLATALPGTVRDRAPCQAGRLTVVHGDALRVDELPGPRPTVLVANLPYNVGVPVLLHLLAQFESIDRALVMVQLEVAERLAAEPGSRTYGVPSAKARWFAHVRQAGHVGRQVFWPAPHVDSGLVALTRRRPPSLDVPREAVFTVIDAAFAQRRKMLRSALAPVAGSAREAEAAITAAGIDPTSRGERLTIDDFVAVARRVPAPGTRD